ncbi:hypothetical protein P4H94_04520 [Paenibacillus macerans]|uniref:hypothetical protein n=1 Tax=Paenibacillus macerans TaxID=44252 RepID=UPI002DBFB573|nr:hypothetical protein [Paenibacillus macerans]MEC0136152.1 hypothetical protein [Paenibacillus macerans]
MNVPAIVFKAKNKEDRYLCYDVTRGDWSDEHLDTPNITDAMLILRKDYAKPTAQNIEEFYGFITNPPFDSDFGFIKNNYEPVEVGLTPEQVETVRIRNGW